MSDADERRIRYQRALAAIDDLGWVFDSYAKRQWEAWLNSSDTDAGQSTRERIWRSAHHAMRVKQELIGEINHYQDEEKLREHRRNG